MSIRIPNLDDTAVIGRGEMLAIGAEHDVDDFAAVPAQGIYLATRGRVPESDNPVAAGRGEVAAVGAECDLEEAIVRLVNPEDSFAVVHLPNAEGPIPPHGGQSSSLRTEVEAGHCPSVPLEDMQRCSGRDIPDPGRTIAAGGGEPGSIRAVHDALNGTYVSTQGTDQLTGLQPPESSTRRPARHPDRSPRNPLKPRRGSGRRD